MLFRSWNEYARAHGEDPGSMVALSARLKKAGFRRTKQAGVRAYRGLALADPLQC